MPEIHDARVAISLFFERELGKDSKAVQIVKVNKAEVGWTGKVQVTESNEYLKKIGYPPIFDKNTYTVTLDENLNVTGYEQGDNIEKEA